MGARLITIPISHFCEKARWALDRAGVSYEERPHLQGIHILAARRAGGGRTVPVLVTGGGDVLVESADILRWANSQTDAGRRLYPDGAHGAEAARLESWLDQGLGPGRAPLDVPPDPADGPRDGSPLPPLDVLPTAYRDEVRRMREHPAGRFAARLYAEKRASPRGVLAPSSA